MLLCLSFVIYINYDNFKILFAKQPDKLNMAAVEFDLVATQIGEAEKVSKRNYRTDYQKRLMMYLRSGRYQDDSWQELDGEVDATFSDLMQSNGFNSLKDERVLPILVLREEVKFADLFAVVSVNYDRETDVKDLVGWGGGLCQFVVDYIERVGHDPILLTGDNLIDNVKVTFNSKLNFTTFGQSDVSADLDGVNLAHIIKNNKYGKTIESNMRVYYSNLNNRARIDMFRDLTFTEQYNSKEEFKTVVYNRIVNNESIMSQAEACGLDLTDANHQKIFDTCLTVFVDYIY